MTTENTQAQAGNNFVNMHVSGIGYISRVREVSVRKGKPFIACSISGFHGEKGVEDGITFVPFDVKVTSAQSEQVIKSLQEQANDSNQKVMVAFRIGDPYMDSYTISKGPRTGQTGTVIKGRLLQITQAWVRASSQSGYECVYKLANQAQTAQAEKAND